MRGYARGLKVGIKGRRSDVILFQLKPLKKLSG